MRQARVVRRLVGGAVAAIVATGSVAVGLATPTYANQPVAVREEAVSDHNTDRRKAVTAYCDDGLTALGAGGRVDDGGGGVVMRAVIPSENSVTVIAEARTGHLGAWAVRAYAVCADVTLEPELTVSTAAASSATAECEYGGSVLVGTGFRLAGPVDKLYLTGVNPDGGLDRVTVSAAAHPEVTVTAIGICHYPLKAMALSPPATTEFDNVWPKTATAEKDPATRAVYGVGGRVFGSPIALSGVFIDALVPNVDRDAAWVRAVHVPGTPVLVKQTRALWATADGGDDGLVIAEAICAGTFY